MDDILEIREGWFADDFIAMDRAFVAAMGRAIRARLERPPGIGIDWRPGTKNPQFIRPQPAAPINGHALGDAADLGDADGSGGWRAPRRPAPISLAGRADSAKA